MPTKKTTKSSKQLRKGKKLEQNKSLTTFPPSPCTKV